MLLRRTEAEGGGRRHDQGRKLHQEMALIGTVRWHWPVTRTARSMPSSQRRSSSLPHDRCLTSAMKSSLEESVRMVVIIDNYN